MSTSASRTQTREFQSRNRESYLFKLLLLLFRGFSHRSFNLVIENLIFSSKFQSRNRNLSGVRAGSPPCFNIENLIFSSLLSPRREFQSRNRESYLFKPPHRKPYRTCLHHRCFYERGICFNLGIKNLSFPSPIKRESTTHKGFRLSMSDRDFSVPFRS